MASRVSLQSFSVHAAVITGIGAFFAITSPYGAITYLDFPARWLYWATTVGSAWVINAMAFAYFAPTRGVWLCALISSILATPVVFLIIYFVQITIDYPVVAEFIPNLVLSIWVICFAMAWAFVPLRARGDGQTIQSRDGKSQLSDQLPFEYRESSIFALEADDHYVHVHTDAGKHLHYIRLRDAIALMTGIPGVRVHRSWWVATSAIEELRREDGRWKLVAKGAGSVPVSRSGQAELRRANLLPDPAGSED